MTSTSAPHPFLLEPFFSPFYNEPRVDNDFSKSLNFLRQRQYSKINLENILREKTLLTCRKMQSALFSAVRSFGGLTLKLNDFFKGFGIYKIFYGKQRVRATKNASSFVYSFSTV